MNGTVSRRSILGATLAGVAGAALSTRVAFAAGAYSGDTLVVISLRGGFDGLSAIVPIGDSAYYTARPGIGVPKSQVIAGDGTFGLHPALAPLLPLWQGGRMAAVHAVGQPNPTRSHFAAMEAMENAAPGTSLRSGWLDRMLGLTGATAPLAGVSLGHAMPARILLGAADDVAMTGLDGFSLAGEGKRPMAAALRAMYADAPAALAGPARSADRALAAVHTVRDAAYAAAATYPDSELGAALRDVARLIKAKAGLVTAAVDCGDWDMHNGLGTAVKGQRMYDNLADLAAALAAFTTDLGPALGSVTVLTISEFGRRVQENASHGADHGHGNAMLLLGGGIRGGKVYADWPGLTPGALVAGDLAATTDYRSVIGEVLQRRCGFGSLDGVFPGVRPSSFGCAVAR
ncbi:hypothetical protein ACWT_4986 [Actinoplanes sp. SE50]|uniref:DUF1501 domain-containing protein n=1 Tax=unclassified Actinoplanes TaxID=2626549 RepID=UPI00023ECB77|nr:MULTISPECIES: DUF1501 domain-containing protein [unclassified Actinoplanes]AEV86003.1 hypothetical protein ACPL_5116 [Actinoplanes sp. SE50/110]ATO84401.1 hypothetical protein ACWT_4986 [Actinoplanes sp. SE50]SLM01811.1 hypothetical protein ACSP50_5049 [Actinoplanes sp. SE50/110]